MDRTKFTEQMTGRLVEVLGVFGRDWSFIPDDLPPDWSFSPHLWPLLDQATSELNRLDGTGKHMPVPNLVIRPLQMREAVRSSSLEGTFAEPEEVMLFEKNPRTPKSEHDKANDWLEVSNYAYALREGFDMLLRGEAISCDMISKLHGILMTGVRGKNKQPGEFRKVAVQIDSNARFVPPPWKDMEKSLLALDDALQLTAEDLKPDWHPLVWCYLVHYQFEAIHPFRDGNGRIGRVLLALMTYKLMKLELPWLYMSAFYDRYKSEYKNNLFECSSDGRWDQWIEYCLTGTITQAKDSCKRLDKLVELSQKYHAKLDTTGNRFHRIIEDLFATPIVSVPDLEKRFDISWPTAKSDIDTLVQQGVLAELKVQKKPRIYYAPDIYAAVYQDFEDQT